ncbi:hypothetical protein MLD38_032639 [Melastoma candidum]|uniref:Uncharacterized protein n=1 Tax=Melastoma candidum TaxID=119954 RepID=A0ACB9M4A8_9MYRT|nr:hypothetical protein MLD38_032639 [Melastoma candidum]
MERQVPFKGILSPHPSENPDFYNWNIVEIRCSHGTSFSGHPDTHPKVKLLQYKFWMWPVIGMLILCPDHPESRAVLPVEVIRNIKTPVFLVNPAYDFWQIQNVLVPLKGDQTRSWLRCRLNIQACSPSQLEILHGHE